MTHQTWLPDMSKDEYDKVREALTSPYRDSTGHIITREEAIERARKYIVRNVRIHDLVDRYLESAFPEEIMEWIIDPETGRFARD